MQMIQLHMATEKILHNFETNVNSNLVILNNWFNINKLSLNPENTKFMMFKKKKQINPVVINFNNIQITEVSFFIFLGIVFNNKLTWTIFNSNAIVSCVHDSRENF